ncbi:hypothetical protein [Oricola cellulosilytica]|uniref:DUF2029 domain-containing protein n=1 Tax=Oricola cellulosilytica TaxID=1429082 RepID=A0A4R0PC78_9HYPH|nr:hypothetical protein [Oricola cellulosilytica]TCD15061.1 hypothetical protein E0D97_05810 [Oricola cellulosilytica]
MNGLVSIVDRMALAGGERAIRVWSSQAARFGLAALALFTLAVAVVAYLFPITNWDIFAYLASAYETPGMNAEALHRHAYETVRNSVTDGRFTVLTEDREYRIRQYADPQAFATMLGFYKVKWLYTASIGWLSELTEPLNAIRLISALSAAAIGGLSIVWLWRERALHLAPLAIAALMLANFGEIARLGTPDAFSAAFFLTGILAFLRKSEIAAGVLLFLAFLARPDHAAYIGVLLAVSLLLRSFSWGVLAAFAGAVIAYVPITQAAGHPGWWIHMWFTHIEFVESLEGFDPPFSLLVYGRIVVQALARSFIENQWPAVLVVGCAGWWLLSRNRVELARREVIILVTTLLGIAAKFAVFPLYETRFHFAYLVAFSLVLIAALARLPKRCATV